MAHFVRIRFVEIRFFKPNNAHRAPVDDFTGCDIVERAAKWIFTDDADIEIAGTRLRAGRNAHELAKIEQVSGFYVVLGGFGLA